jgi:hypothetical protein
MNCKKKRQDLLFPLFSLQKFDASGTSKIFIFLGQKCKILADTQKAQFNKKIPCTYTPFRIWNLIHIKEGGLGFRANKAPK